MQLKTHGIFFSSWEWIRVLSRLLCHPFPSRAFHSCQPRWCHPCVTHKATEARKLWLVRGWSGREPGSESTAGAAFASELALPVSPVREFSQEVFNKHILCAWRWSWCEAGVAVAALLWTWASGSGRVSLPALPCICREPWTAALTASVSSLGSKATCEGVGALLRIRADTEELACWQVLSQRLLWKIGWCRPEGVHVLKLDNSAS